MGAEGRGQYYRVDGAAKVIAPVGNVLSYASAWRFVECLNIISLLGSGLAEWWWWCCQMLAV